MNGFKSSPYSRFPEVKENHDLQNLSVNFEIKSVAWFNKENVLKPTINWGYDIGSYLLAGSKSSASCVLNEPRDDGLIWKSSSNERWEIWKSGGKTELCSLIQNSSLHPITWIWSDNLTCWPVEMATGRLPRCVKLLVSISKIGYNLHNTLYWSTCQPST